MKGKTVLVVLLCCCVSFMGVSFAWADATEVFAVIKSSDPGDPTFECDTLTGLDVDVCNVFAAFSDPTDNLLSIGFSNITTDSATGFYQNGLGSDRAPLQQFVDIFPDLACDSFVTIGLKVVPLGGTDCTTTDPDFDSDLFNTQLPPPDGSQVVGGWFCNNPPGGQGIVGDDLQILIAQFTVPAGSNVSGELTVFFNAGDNPFVTTFECFPAGECEVDADCDDGIACNGMETCDANFVCQAGTPVDCNDNVACTVDVCNEPDGSCSNTPDDGFCDDGQFCNGAETCDAVNDCQAGTPVDCNDNVACTVDSCNEGTDSCDNVPDDTFCDDGQFCNGAETCDAVNDCQAGTPVDCNDNVDCTVDSCNEGTDSCDNVADDGFCDDGLACNGSETCDPVNDCQAGTPVNCDDGVGCTVDVCNEPDGSCSNTPDDTFCDDGLTCNGLETCDPVNDCQAGTPVDCDDGVDCTVDVCNEPDGSCTNTADDGFCDDGQFCNGSETCDPVNDCQAGTPVDCNDDVGCTVDSCNEGTDSCDNTPDDGFCDNGQFCDGMETCDPVNDCQAGTPVDCNDDVSCTVDSCNEGTDSCDNLPDDGFCDDGLACNGVETCDAVNDCQAGMPVDCDDGVGCTIDACNEPDGSCSNTPDDSACDDGNVCTDDICDAMADCQNPISEGLECAEDGDCGAGEACIDCFCEVVEVPGASIDIKPGNCQNPLNLSSNGVLKVALAGSESFDVLQVDLSSLQFGRADGMGDTIAPLDGPPGPKIKIEDGASAFFGELCGCPDPGPDGFLDVIMKFSVDELSDALGFNGTGFLGKTIQFRLSGTLLDGTPFAADDCALVVPPGGWDPVNVIFEATYLDTYLELFPADQNVDDDGFANFARSYGEGTLVEVTAPPQAANGAAFLGWSVDGELQFYSNSATLKVSAIPGLKIKAHFARSTIFEPDDGGFGNTGSLPQPGL